MVGGAKVKNQDALVNRALERRESRGFNCGALVALGGVLLFAGWHVVPDLLPVGAALVAVAFIRKERS